MTCIVGLEYDGGVIIGGDSAGLSGWQKTIRTDEKVFTTGDYVMGFTDSYRMGQLLRYHFKLDGPDTWDVDRFMATTFVNEVRDTLTEGGWAKSESGQEKGGTFLVGVVGRLYAIHSDYQFERCSAGFNAVGCGDDIALGSMHTSAQLDLGPHRRVELALEAAAALSGGVQGPFVVIDQAVPACADQ